jgi:hypothetical protein
MRAVVILCLLLGGVSASAQSLSIYAGGSVGAFTYDNPRGGAFSDTVSSWKLYGGVQLARHFGFEIGHGSTSELNGDPSGSPVHVGVRYFSVAHSADFTLTTVKAMGYLPFDWGALWMGYGFFLMDADATFTNANAGRASLSVDDTDDVAALGIEWRLRRPFDRSIDLRLEYESWGFPFSDAATIGIGVAYRFEGM